MSRSTRGMSLFGACDTGSNNSDSSSSREGYNIFDRNPDWYTIPPGIPTHCYCGELCVVKTQTRGAHIGRRYYSCSGPMDDGECHIYRLWDDAVMEEISQLKKKVTEVDDRLLEWIGSPDHMSPSTMWDLYHSSKEDKEKLKELQEEVSGEKEKLKELQEKLMVKESEEKVYGEKKMRFRNGIVITTVFLILFMFMYLV